MLLVVSIIAAPLMTIASASALTDTQKKQCYDELDAKTITITTSQSGVSIKNTTLSQDQISACVQANVCTQTTVASGGGYGGGYVEYSYNCIPTSDQAAVSKVAADAQSCYNLLNGKTVAWIPPSNTPTINGKPIDSNQFNGCVTTSSTASYCQVNNAAGIVNTDHVKTYICTPPKVYADQAGANDVGLSKEVAPIITLYCDTSNGTSLLSTLTSTYSTCAASVKSAFDACRNTQQYVGSDLTTVRDSPANIANCIITKVPRIPPLAPIDKTALTAAVQAGQTAADQYTTSVGQALVKAQCDARANDGYTWSVDASGNGQCIPPNTNSPDDCPLPPEASMRWLGCSVFSLLKGTTDALKSQINNYLFADPNALMGPNAQSAATIFRNIGMVLIVIAGLFMVISQALGFEFLDAYTVRKLLPRLGVALIGMALAWPLLKFALTLTNDLGGLINSVFMDLASKASSGTSGTDIGTTIGAALTGTAGAAAIIAAMGVGGLLSLVASVVLALLVAFVVLAIRQLIIFMAVILAPLAIAAYVIPGGQKLWDFWKKTLITTLFMYPLVMGFIAAGAAMAAIMPKQTNAMAIMAIVIYFAPFFMLPFAFKMAGGLMGTIFSMANDKNRGAFDRLKKFRQGQLEKRGSYYKQRYGDRVMQARASAVRSLNASSSKYGRVRGGLLRTAGRQIAGLGGIEDKMSAINARTGKAIQDEIATGADDRIRGLTVDRSMGFATAQSQGLARIDGGRRQWKSLAGKWINESDVVEGQRQWGHDVAAQQAALSYEMRKASSEEEATGISKRYNSLATKQWGMTDAQAGGAWIGAAFENQNSRLEYKYTDWANGGSLKRGDVTTAAGEKQKTALGAGLVDEIYDKRGSYSVAQMGSTTIGQLQEAYKDASLMTAGFDANGNRVTYSAEQISAATDQKQKIEAIAETFMHQYGSVGGEADDVARQIASQSAQAGGSRTANTPGAAHTAERVRQLAEMTGVYGAAPSGQYSNPLGRAGSDNPRPQS